MLIPKPIEILYNVEREIVSTWTFMRVPANKSFRYFVVGENSVIGFSCTCEYQRQTMSYKDFIDGTYERIKEVYAEFDDAYAAKDFIYAQANKALKKSGGTELDDIFDTFAQTHWNAYKFTLPLDGEAGMRSRLLRKKTKYFPYKNEKKVFAIFCRYGIIGVSGTRK